MSRILVYREPLVGITRTGFLTLLEYCFRGTGTHPRQEDFFPTRRDSFSGSPLGLTEAAVTRIRDYVHSYYGSHKSLRRRYIVVGERAGSFHIRAEHEAEMAFRVTLFLTDPANVKSPLGGDSFRRKQLVAWWPQGVIDPLGSLPGETPPPGLPVYARSTGVGMWYWFRPEYALPDVLGS